MDAANTPDQYRRSPLEDAAAIERLAARGCEVRDLKEAMSQAVRRLGYHGFDAWSVSSNTLEEPRQDQNFLIADYATSLLETFLSSGFVQDCPVTAAAARRSSPFDYVEALRTLGKNSSTRWQKRILDLQGVTHAWIVPLNTIHHMRGATLYLKGARKGANEHFQSTKGAAVALASAFMEGVLQIRAAPQTDMAGEVAELTIREADCLQWVARGKTNWEVSCILSISENTVRYHLKNAFRKLDVTTRAGAVRKAAAAELIRL